MIKTLRTAMMIVLPAVFAGALMARQLTVSAVVDWTYILALSGLVGFGTNWFAIRMLFRPVNKTILGRQGLIPGRKKELASMVAEEIEQRLLNVDILEKYVTDNSLTDKFFDLMGKGLSSLLSEGETRKVIRKQIALILDRNRDRLSNLIREKGQNALDTFLKEKLKPSEIWEMVRPHIQRLIEDGRIRDIVAMKLFSLIVENSENIKNLIINAIENHLDKGKSMADIIKSLGYKAAREMGMFDGEDIKTMIIDIVKSEEIRTKVLNLIDHKIIELDEYLAQNPEIHHKLSEFAKTVLNDIAEEKAIPFIEKKVEELLRKPGTWKTIDILIIKAVEEIDVLVKELVRNENVKEKLTALMSETANMIDIKGIVEEQINRQDTEELEQMVKKVSSDQLSGIEVIGGALGILAGTVLINPWFVLAFPAIAVGILSIEKAASFRGKI